LARKDWPPQRRVTDRPANASDRLGFEDQAMPKHHRPAVALPLCAFDPGCGWPTASQSVERPH
jgi:hypothetical protein